MERRLQVLHVKMEGALVVGCRVGGTDMLPSGDPGPGGGTIGGLCEARAAQSRVTGPLFSGPHH